MFLVNATHLLITIGKKKCAYVFLFFAEETCNTNKASDEMGTAEDEDQIELGFSLQIVEPKMPYGTDKDCDSSVHTVNFASSFNTDVGYSSETSRAPSYPSSVVFKRRTFTNKSVSQNYSSLTESIGSQVNDAIRSTPSPMDDVKAIRMPCDSRRLSYKRACDPDKRVSLAFDSMFSEDSDLSYGSQQLPMATSQNAIGYCLTDNCNVSRAHVQVKCEKFVSEGTATDTHWMRRQSLKHRKISSVWNSSVQFCLQIRTFLRRIVRSPWMDFFITVSIVLNTIFLAAEHHGMSVDVKQVLDVGNKVSIDLHCLNVYITCFFYIFGCIVACALPGVSAKKLFMRSLLPISAD